MLVVIESDEFIFFVIQPFILLIMGHNSNIKCGVKCVWVISAQIVSRRGHKKRAIFSVTLWNKSVVNSLTSSENMTLWLMIFAARQSIYHFRVLDDFLTIFCHKKFQLRNYCPGLLWSQQPQCCAVLLHHISMNRLLCHLWWISFHTSIGTTSRSSCELIFLNL